MRWGPSWVYAKAALAALITGCAAAAQRNEDAIGRAAAPVREPSILEIRLAQHHPGPALRGMALVGRADTVYVSDDIVVSDDAVDSIFVRPTPTGLLLDVHFTADGAARLAEVTRANVGRQLAIIFTPSPYRNVAAIAARM
jgi:hypothetical protein